MNKYEEEKAKIIADHIRREGTKPLDKAEEFMLWFLDQEKKLAQKKITNLTDMAVATRRGR